MFVFVFAFVLLVVFVFACFFFDDVSCDLFVSVFLMFFIQYQVSMSMPICNLSC